MEEIKKGQNLAILKAQIQGVVFSISDEDKLKSIWNFIGDTRPTPDSNIVWEGECPHTKTDPAHIDWPYSCCNGTGTITRPATLEEIKENIRDFGEVFELENGGRLRVKE